MGSCISKDEKRNLNLNGKNGLLNSSNVNSLGNNANRDLFRSDNHSDQRSLMPVNKLNNLSSNHRLNNNAANNDSSNRTNNLTNHQNSQTVIALYSYTAKDEGDLSFKKGDLLLILDDTGAYWDSPFWELLNSESVFNSIQMKTKLYRNCTDPLSLPIRTRLVVLQADRHQ